MSCSCANTNTSTTASAAVEALCQQSMGDCQSVAYADTRSCGGCSGEPLSMTEPRDGGSQTQTERCCDRNGCCGIWLRCCRDPFWPLFAHPSWLCCKDLYRK